MEKVAAEVEREKRRKRRTKKAAVERSRSSSNLVKTFTWAN